MNKTFAENLALLRAEKGMTQRELGAAAGVAWSMISKYESGQSIPRLKVLLNLAAALNVPVERLRESTPGEAEPRLHAGFSSRLVAARAAAGLSKKALSEKCGIAVEVLNEFELGMVFPDRTDIVALSTALEVPIEQLYGTKDEEETVLIAINFGERDSTEEGNLIGIEPEAFRAFSAAAERLGLSHGDYLRALLQHDISKLDDPKGKGKPLRDIATEIKESKADAADPKPRKRYPKD